MYVGALSRFGAKASEAVERDGGPDGRQVRGKSPGPMPALPTGALQSDAPSSRAGHRLNGLVPPEDKISPQGH
jgi:hypothetical protein